MASNKSNPAKESLEEYDKESVEDIDTTSSRRSDPADSFIDTTTSRQTKHESLSEDHAVDTGIDAKRHIPPQMRDRQLAYKDQTRAELPKNEAASISSLTSQRSRTTPRTIVAEQVIPVADGVEVTDRENVPFADASPITGTESAQVVFVDGGHRPQLSNNHASTAPAIEGADGGRRGTAKSRYIVCPTIILALAALAVSLFCSSGRCTTGSEGKDANAPTTALVDRPPTGPSDAPTLVPNSSSPVDPSRGSFIVAYINQISFAGPIAYPGNFTAEQRALRWLVDEDPLDLTAQANQIRLQQRYALATLWFHSTQPWDEQESWLTEEHECDWFGVIRCSVVQRERIPSVLNLSNNSLNGKIPGDIRLLSSLSLIDLSLNELTGSIPQELGLLDNLEFLNLQENNLIGTLPFLLGNSDNLKTLNLSRNRLTGTLPQFLGLYDSLTELRLDDNFFSGPVEYVLWVSWPALTYLNVSTNTLTGPLLSPYGLSYFAIETFDASNNNFAGALPAIAAWENITVFSVHTNALTGTIPSVLATWGQLQDVRFHNNLLTGTIPLCPAENRSIERITADCMEVNCSCCTECF